MTDTFRALCAELLLGLDENRHPEVRYPGHLRLVMADARAALSQPEPEGPTPQPIPVSERLPEEPLAWWFTPESDEEYGWWVLETEGMERVPPPTHWLPAHALPVPTHTSEND